MPPLIQGVGVLALPGLLDVAASWLKDFPGLAAPATRIAGLARELAVDRNPWAMLIAAVGLSVGARLLQSWRRAAERRPDENASGPRCRPAGRLFDWRRRGPWPRSDPGDGSALFSWPPSLAAVNLAPALLFTPWMDGRTITPAMLILADGREEARLQAAVLAFCRDRRQPRRSLCRAARSGAASRVGPRSTVNRAGIRLLASLPEEPCWPFSAIASWTDSTFSATRLAMSE